MSTYCTDSDLEKLRPEILQLGPTAWPHQLAEATRIVDRALTIGWYRAAARQRGLDPDHLPFSRANLLHADEQLTMLAACKALHLVYLYLAKGHPDEPFHHLAATWEARYAAELADVLAAGLDYDWDGSANIAPAETARPLETRILERL